MKTNLREEITNLRRTPEAIVFYAARRDCYPTFEGLVEELTDTRNLAASYVTSDSTDPVLRGSNHNLKPFYLNKLFPLFMALAKCKVFVMTLPDLNRFHIRRSINPTHYVYVFHSLVSTHMIYLRGAFDHYDSVLCCGPHQVEEMRRYEKLEGLPPKVLVEAGYYRLERVYDAYQKYVPTTNGETVLLAPSWGPNNILEACSPHLVELLLKAGYRVTVRPHPETVRRAPRLIKRYIAEFSSNPNFALETSVATDTSLLAADVLISDYSGVALEYALGTERPVVFIDVPPKIRNPRYYELGLEPIEMSLRDKIGAIVSPENIRDVPAVIREVRSRRDAWKSTLSRLRGEYTFNFGRASRVGADYIRSLL